MLNDEICKLRDELNEVSYEIMKKYIKNELEGDK